MKEESTDVEYYSLTEAKLNSSECMGASYYDLTYSGTIKGVYTVKHLTVKLPSSILTKASEDQLLLINER